MIKNQLQKNKEFNLKGTVIDLIYNWGVQIKVQIPIVSQLYRFLQSILHTLHFFLTYKIKQWPLYVGFEYGAFNIIFS